MEKNKGKKSEEKKLKWNFKKSITGVSVLAIMTAISILSYRAGRKSGKIEGVREGSNSERLKLKSVVDDILKEANSKRISLITSNREFRSGRSDGFEDGVSVGYDRILGALQLLICRMKIRNEGMNPDSFGFLNIDIKSKFKLSDKVWNKLLKLVGD